MKDEVLGNKIFSLETNLQCLISRIVKSNLMGALEVAEDMQKIIEKIKNEF